MKIGDDISDIFRHENVNKETAFVYNRACSLDFNQPLPAQ